MADNEGNDSNQTPDSELFSGSVDRSKLEEMKAAAGDDPERQRLVDEVQAQVDAVAESDEAAEKARQEALDARREQAEAASESPSESSEDQTQYDEQVDEGTTVEAEEYQSAAPPRAGAGSNRDAWVAYAESQGVTVTDDMTRDEIIEAVEG